MNKLSAPFIYKGFTYRINIKSIHSAINNNTFNVLNLERNTDGKFINVKTIIFDHGPTVINIHEEYSVIIPNNIWNTLYDI